MLSYFGMIIAFCYLCVYLASLWRGNNKSKGIRMISSLVKQFNKHFSILVIVLVTGLTGCGGGDSDPAPVIDNTPATQSISGGGVKGPLANAVVTVFAFDPSQPGFKGAVVATATTDSKAAITGLSLPLPLDPPYIMEFTSTPGTTTDITTGAFPVITTMRTVITQALLDGGEQLYATPSTTLAADVAVLTATDSNGDGIKADEFETALASAASLVISTLGFGMDGSVDIFDAPPLVDNTTVGDVELAKVAAYRTAVEALTAMAYQISLQVSGATADTVLADIAADLADDGLINGSAGTTLDTNTLQVLEQAPAMLPIPNSPNSQTVADVQAILAAETATTGATTDTTALTDGTVVTLASPAETNPDIDGDEVLNADDAFPEDASESVDTDGDGIGDVADPDDDNNGILDEDEGVVPTPIANDADLDGVDDGVDNCPVNFNPAQTDTDGDTEGDACDADDDGDGVDDVNDAFPLDIDESVDTDGDGTGDVADIDADNDGVDDVDEEDDMSPIDGTTSCSVLPDCDGDGVLDGVDFDPVDPLVTINFAPVANNDSATTNEDAATFSIDVTANDTDNDGNPNDNTITLTAIGINNTGLGAVGINGNNIEYTPVADASGTDTFTYSVTDGTGASATATVTVTIVAVNDDPLAALDEVETDEDTSVTTVNVLDNDTDIDGDTLSVEAGNPVASNGVVVNNNDGTFTYTPNANFNTTDSFTYTVIDGNGGSATGTVEITVIAVNDNPTASPDTAMTDEDTPVTTVNVTLNDSDVDGIAVLSVLSGDPTALNGTVVNHGDGTFTYTPNADYHGPDSFTYNLSDGSTGAAVGTVNITVKPVNDDPVAVLDEIETDEDSSISTGNVTKNDTDVEGDSLTADLLAQANHGIVVEKGGSSFTYTPNPGFSGPDSFTYTLSDGNGGTATGTVKITVNPKPLNDPPFADIDNDETVEDTPFTTINVLANDTDSDGPSALFVQSADTATAGGGSVADNGDGTFDYTPFLDFNGLDEFSYTVSDGQDTSVGTVFINVIPENDQPVAGSDSATTTVDTAVTTGNVLLNDTDVDEDSLFVVAGNPTAVNGTVVNHGDGTFTYTPSAGFTGVDSFAYTVSDSDLTDSGTVTVTVTPDGTPIPMTTLMSPSEGGVAGIDNRGPDEYEYWTENWDSISGLFTLTDYAYNHATSVFDATTGNSDLYLSAGSWVLEGNIYATDDGSDGLIASVRDAGDDAVEIANVRVTARYVDIGGELIANYLDAVWQGAMIDPNAVFNTGAKLITEYRFEQLTESYNLWVSDWCQLSDPARYTILNGNCNAIYSSTNQTGYAQTLDEVIVATAWEDPDDGSTPPGGISIAWDGSKTLMLELVNGGAANYYVVDYNDQDPVTRVVAAGAGTDWIRNNDPGVDMIQFQVPASFAVQFPDADLGDSPNYFLAVQNGYVRYGVKDVMGSVDFDNGAFNGNAMNDILANFSAPRVLNCNTIGSPYSYTDFEAVIADCGPFPMSAVDLENKTFASFNNPDEVIAYNAGGTGLFSNDGGLTTYPITWSIDVNGYLDIASASPLITPFRDKLVAYGIDPFSGGAVIKVYSEDSDTGSDLVFDGTADGEIWDDIVVEVTQLSCGYTTPLSGVTGQPLVFNSFTDFETVVADCGGVLAIVETDVIGAWVETWIDQNGDWEEIVTFNADGSGSFAETLNGVAQGTPVPFSWSLISNMVFITDNVEIVDVWAWTVSGMKAYTEDSGWGSDLVPDATADGKIWDAFYVKQQDL